MWLVVMMLSYAFNFVSNVIFVHLIGPLNGNVLQTWEYMEVLRKRSSNHSNQFGQRPTMNSQDESPSTTGSYFKPKDLLTSLIKKIMLSKLEENMECTLFD
jgi:hypothetical protein